MTCPDCGSTNTGDAAAATYADSVCKDCGHRFMHEDEMDEYDDYDGGWNG